MAWSNVRLLLANFAKIGAGVLVERGFSTILKVPPTILGPRAPVRSRRVVRCVLRCGQDPAAQASGKAPARPVARVPLALPESAAPRGTEQGRLVGTDGVGGAQVASVNCR